MTVKITINDTRVLPAEPGRSLLATLRDAQVFILSACGGRGACGTCQVKVLDGVDTPLSPSEKHWLSDNDQADHIRLACQVKVERDLRIEIPPESFTIREHRTQVLSLQDLTYDIKELRLKLIDPPEMSFKAGQFVQFRFPDLQADGPIYRSFSMASDPLIRNELVFQARCIPKGLCTPYIHKQMKVGDELTIVGPWGSVHLRDNDRDIIFIAGGSGLSPVRSMLFEMINRRCARRARFFFGAKTTRDLYRMDELRAFEKQLADFQFIPALSNPEPGDNWTGETGLITEVVDRQVKDASNADAYLCGSPMMVNACIKLLTAKGLPNDRIFFDKFV